MSRLKMEQLRICFQHKCTTEIQRVVESCSHMFTIHRPFECKASRSVLDMRAPHCLQQNHKDCQLLRRQPQSTNILLLPHLAHRLKLQISIIPVRDNYNGLELMNTASCMSYVSRRKSITSSSVTLLARKSSDWDAIDFFLLR